MGRKERRRKEKLVQQSAATKGVNKHYLDNQILKARADNSAAKMKFQETIIRIVKELGKLKNDFAVLNEVLKRSGLITKENIEQAVNALEENARSMFDEEGKMKGKPIVTCYNCDFKLKEIDGAIIKTEDCEWN